MRASVTLSLLLVPVFVFGHGSVTQQMKVAVAKVVEAFETSHKGEADKVLQITTEKTGDEAYRVLLKLPSKTYSYDCGLNIPVDKKWGCRQID